MSFVAGQRISARCSRCKDITGHIVIVVLNNTPVKVECCACGSIHKYTAPPSAKKKEETSPLKVRANQERGEVVEQASKQASMKAPTKTSTTKPKTIKKATPLTGEEAEQAWKDTLAHSYAAPKAYSMTVELKLGDSIDHPTFGVGVVQSIVAADKAKILFKEGEKILKCIAH